MSGLPSSAGRPPVVVVMGVCGSGKTTVGTRLAERLGWRFLDGDDLHPAHNRAKMAAGEALTDDDRAAWLAALHDRIADHLAAGRPVVLACSALRARYRAMLAGGNPGTTFVYLKGSYDLIQARLQCREHHYMGPDMLASQFDALEEPTNAITVSVDQQLGSVVDEILAALADDDSGAVSPDR